MSSVISIALGGLQAASRRLAVSANNIATGSASRLELAPRAAARPSGGQVNIPDAGLIADVVALSQAIASYRANATVIRVQRDLDAALLDLRI